MGFVGIVTVIPLSFFFRFLVPNFVDFLSAARPVNSNLDRGTPLELNFNVRLSAPLFESVYISLSAGLYTNAPRTVALLP